MQDKTRKPIRAKRRGDVQSMTLSAEADARLREIQEAAYYKSQRRGFVPGHEMDDWLEAEREVTGTIAGS